MTTSFLNSSSSKFQIYTVIHIEDIKTILVAENTDFEIENAYILKSPYIRTIKSKIGENEVVI